MKRTRLHHLAPRRAGVLAAGACLSMALSAALALAATGSTPIRARAAGVLTPGTPRHPQGVKVRVNFAWHGLSASSQPVLTNLDIWFPRGSLYNGARYPRCSVRTLDARGPGGCPKGSIMGHGSGVAFADTTISRPTITVVNGGANFVYFYTILNNPARVQEAVIGHITRTRGDFTYHLSTTIPENLRIVAGVPIRLTDLNVTAGHGTWLAITGPPAGIKVTTTFDTGQTTSTLVLAQDS
jgi:hypothetical protein